MAGSPSPAEDRPFFAHLIELRNRLLWCVLAVIALFVAMFPFADTLFSYVVVPLLSALPSGATLVATAPVSTFMVPMRLAFLAALGLAAPFFLYQVWAFVAPGLYRHERRMVWPLLTSSTVLFYLGAAFAYFVVLPLVFRFLIGAAPTGVTPMPDIGQVLDFITAMFLAFGVAFEIPVATVLLVQTGVASREALRNARPYVVVGAFVLGAIFTPPDVVSQLLLAIPVWLLFELGLFLSGWFGRRVSSNERETEV